MQHCCIVCTCTFSEPFHKNLSVGKDKSQLESKSVIDQHCLTITFTTPAAHQSGPDSLLTNWSNDHHQHRNSRLYQIALKNEHCSCTTKYDFSVHIHLIPDFTSVPMVHSCSRLCSSSWTGWIPCLLQHSYHSRSKNHLLTRKKKDSNRMHKIWRWIHSMDVLKSWGQFYNSASPVSSHRVGRWYEAMARC